MDHLVLVDDDAKEIDRLIAGHKTVIIRTAEKEETPFREVEEKDRLYFISSARPAVVLASATVKNVLFRENLEPDECTELIKTSSGNCLNTIMHIHYFAWTFGVSFP